MQAAAQILASTNEQVAGINQVAIAMDNIRSASDQIVISMRQAEDATSSLNQMSSKLWSLIERFKVSLWKAWIKSCEPGYWKRF